MPPQRCQKFSEFGVREEPTGHKPLADVFRPLDEVHSPRMAHRPFLNAHLLRHVHQSGTAHEHGEAPPDEAILVVLKGEGLQCLHDARPCGMRRVTHPRQIVRFPSGDHTTGAGQRHHLRENLLRIRHIHQYEPFVYKIKVTSGQPSGPGIALNDLDISKPMLSNEFSCQRDEPFIPLKAHNSSRWANLIREDMQDSLRTASHIDDPPPGLDACAFEVLARPLFELNGL